MPYIRITSPNGMNWHISSADHETVGRWFAETISRELIPQEQYFEWRMYIQPLVVPAPNGRAQPDWCADSTHWAHHEFTFGDGLEGLITALQKMRE